MGVLDDIAAAVSKVAQTAGPSVVGIGGRWRRGSGIVVGKDRVLTNAHNLHGEGATCVFADGREARGRVLGVDFDGDLAVLEVETADAPVLPWADAAVAIGTPVFGVAGIASGGVRTTVGLVSAIGRSFRGPGGWAIGGSVEHTAPMAPGSSGSPVVDAQGRMLGLNTQRVGEGFYLAVPADAALRSRVDALARGESAAGPRLGVAVAPSRVARHLRRAVGLPDLAGVLVRGVEEGSPADTAGIREGDLIVSVGGKPIEHADDLHDALSKVGHGKLDIGIVRGAEEIAVKADLGAGDGGYGAGGSAGPGKPD